MTDSKQIIEELVAGHQVLNPCLSVRNRYAIYLSGLLIYSAGVIYLMSFMPETHDKVQDYQFLFNTVLLFISATTLSYLAISLSVPGRPLQLSKKIFLIVSLILLVILVKETIASFTSFNAQTLSFDKNSLCSKAVIMFSVAPALGLFYLVRMAAPLARGLTFLVVLLSASILGAVLIDIVCASNYYWHILIYHYLPVVILGVVGYLGVRRIY